MLDDVLINKAATIERCVARAREEYLRDPASFATDSTHQDAAPLISSVPTRPHRTWANT